MFKKRFFPGLMGGIFAVTLLLNCAAKSTPDTKQVPTTQSASTQPKSMEEAISTIEEAIGKADLEEKVLTGL